MLAGIVAFLVVQQLAFSRARLEQMPFFSNYPMYSRVAASPQEFNRLTAPAKWYRYEIRSDDGDDLTRDAEESGLLTAVNSAMYVHYALPGTPLDPATRETLVDEGAEFREERGQDIRRIEVVTERREFDFSDGRLETLPEPSPKEIDLRSGRIIG